MGCAFSTSHPQAPVINHNENLSQKNGGRSSKKTHRIDCRKKSTQFVDTINQNVILLDRQLQKQEMILAKQVLNQHYLFSQLDNEEIQAIIEQILPAEALQNKYIFKQGDNGYCFFIIKEGTVEIEVDGQVSNRLSKKDSFGQLALLYATSRTASAKCIGQNNQFLIVKTILLRKTLKQINIRNYQKIKYIINQVQAFGFLTNKQKSSLANIMMKVNFRKNQVIYCEKDPALAFYVVVQGSVTIQVPNKETGLVLGKYQSFGESSFWQEGKRLGTVVAKEDTVCMMIGKNQIMKCFGESFSNVVYFNIQKWALRSCQLLKQMSPQEVDKISSQFKIKYGRRNEVLAYKNTKPSGIIICLEGKINNQSTGAMFNHQFYKQDGVLEEEIVKNDQGVYSYLDFQALRETILKVINKRRRQSKMPIESEKQNNLPINMNNFQCIKKLGEGQFGQVYLVRDPKMGGAYYALKCLDKESIRRQSMESCVISEKRILESISFPYIVGFFKAYADRKYIYLLTEFINGMEMFDVIREIGLLNRTIGRYFFASLLLSVEYLHSGNIIYRDIKPENSVVDSKGKVYLIDLGTAKILKSQTLYRTFTIIGTPHYLAPQVMQGKGYTFDVDYWSLGVLLFEFLCGKLPFAQNLDDPYAIYAQVMKSELKFPKFFNDENAKQIISKLIQKNPSNRSNEGGFNAIKQSPYFSDFSWSDLQKQKMMPAYIPKKYRTTQQNYNKMDSTPFLTFLYKQGAKLKRSNSNPTFNPTVMEWNQKFQD